MNKFIENEHLPNFEFKFKFLEDVRKPLALKRTRKRMEERNKMPETREESQSTVLAEENQINVGKGNQTGNAEKKSSIYSRKPNHCNLYKRSGFF